MKAWVVMIVTLACCGCAAQAVCQTPAETADATAEATSLTAKAESASSVGMIPLPREDLFASTYHRGWPDGPAATLARRGAGYILTLDGKEILFSRISPVMLRNERPAILTLGEISFGDAAGESQTVLRAEIAGEKFLLFKVPSVGDDYSNPTSLQRAALHPTELRVTGSHSADGSAMLESSIVASDGRSILHGLQVRLGTNGRILEHAAYDEGFQTLRVRYYPDGQMMIRQSFSRSPFGTGPENGTEVASDHNSPVNAIAFGKLKDGVRWNGTFLTAEPLDESYTAKSRLAIHEYRDGEFVKSEPVSDDRLGFEIGDDAGVILGF